VVVILEKGVSAPVEEDSVVVILEKEVSAPVEEDSEVVILEKEVSASLLKQHATSAATNAPSHSSQEAESQCIAVIVSEKMAIPKQEAVPINLQTWIKSMKNSTK